MTQAYQTLPKITELPKFFEKQTPEGVMDLDKNP